MQYKVRVQQELFLVFLLIDLSKYVFLSPFSTERAMIRRLILHLVFDAEA